MSPEVGLLRVVSMDIKVDFPAPLGPSSPKISPPVYIKIQVVQYSVIPELLYKLFHFYLFPTMHFDSNSPFTLYIFYHIQRNIVQPNYLLYYVVYNTV